MCRAVVISRFLTSGVPPHPSVDGSRSRRTREVAADCSVLKRMLIRSARIITLRESIRCMCDRGSRAHLQNPDTVLYIRRRCADLYHCVCACDTGFLIISSRISSYLHDELRHIYRLLFFLVVRGMRTAVHLASPALVTRRHRVRKNSRSVCFRRHERAENSGSGQR